MGQVNRIPNGFLDLLGVESLGRNPPAFADAIQPMVNLTEFYAAQTLSSHEEDFNHTAAGDQVIVRVPSEETWFLRSVSVRADGLASTSEIEVWEFGIQDTARNSTGGATEESIIAVSPRLITFASGGGRSASFGFYLGSPGLALTAGTILRARIIDRSGAVRTSRLNWMFNRYNS